MGGKAKLWQFVTSNNLKWLIQQSEYFQFAVVNFIGQISVHYPKYVITFLFQVNLKTF